MLELNSRDLELNSRVVSRIEIFRPQTALEPKIFRRRFAPPNLNSLDVSRLLKSLELNSLVVSRLPSRRYSELNQLWTFAQNVSYA